MVDASDPAPIWLIWPSLSWLERVSFLPVWVACGYSVLLAIRVVFLNDSSGRGNVVRFRKCLRNLQQATVAAFYLFGFVLFAGFQFAYVTIEHSSTQGPN